MLTLSIGDRLTNELFFIVTMKEKTAKNLKQYLSVCFATSTSRIYGNLWDTSLETSKFQEGDYVWINGIIDEFNGSGQLNISNIEKAYDVTLEPYHPDVHFADLKQRFYNLVNSIPLHSESGQLLNRIMSDQQLMEKYFRAPAAVTMHHNFVYGLLLHSVSVAEYVAQRASERERNIGIVAGLMHDIGKIDIYEFFGPTVRFSELGKFMDHISHGVGILKPFLQGVRNEYTYPLINAILGHHGKLEHGSPILPKTPFAWLVYHADLWDSHSQHLLDLEYKQGWNGNKDGMFGVELYQV